jgi:heat shock protein HslJ
MRRLKAATAALLLLLVSAACSAGGATPSPSAVDPSALLGSWVLVAGTGPDGEVPIIDGARITLDIQGADVGGTSACNHYFGRIAVSGNKLRIDQLGGTEMACQPDVMGSEAAYLAALGGVTRWARDGDSLTLSGPIATLTYELLPPVPDAEMVDVVWVLDTLISGDVASSVEGGPTLELRSDGTLVGSTGCRTFTGRYRIAGDEVQMTDLAMEGECSADLAAQDSHVVTVLGDGFTVQIEGNRLTLGAFQDQGLGYTAEAAAE